MFHSEGGTEGRRGAVSMGFCGRSLTYRWIGGHLIRMNVMAPCGLWQERGGTAEGLPRGPGESAAELRCLQPAQATRSRGRWALTKPRGQITR